MTNIEDRLLSIEVSIDNLDDTLSESSKYLKIISRELIISNLPQSLHIKQREMFDLCDKLDTQQYMLKHYKQRLREAKDDASSDGFKDDIEKKQKKIDELYVEMGVLSNEGCIVV